MIGVSERHRRPDISVVPRTPTRESCRYKATGTAASGMPATPSRPRAPAGARDLKAIPPRPNALRPTASQDYLAIGLHPAASPVPWPSVSGRIRRLYDFELEPEVRDWLDSLSDSDFKRVDEVCGLLAEKGAELGGPWSDHLDGAVWELRIRLRDVAARITSDRVPQDQAARPEADRPGGPGAETLRTRSPGSGSGNLRKAGVMTGYHTRWVRRPEQADDPERIAIREALAFGKAVYDQRCALAIAELAGRASLTADGIECIEEGGTEPTIALLRRLAAALDSDVRLTAGHDLGSVWFETHAA